MRGLRKFLTGRDPDPAGTPPHPQPPVCVIGDLHGRLDLMERMLQTAAARPDAGEHRTVFVGDLIDRGPDSAAILRRLSEMTRAAPGRVICLMGNHERMMLDFLDDPVQNGPLWLSNGGGETLASFGLAPWSRGGNGAEGALARLGAELAEAMGPDLRRWLAARPLCWSEGALAVTHAGPDPTRAMAEQVEHDCLWGHPAFYRQVRRDGIWVVHGHDIVPRAHAAPGRIAVDTGAWRTGRLSAAWLSADGLEFIEVTDA